MEIQFIRTSPFAYACRVCRDDGGIVVFGGAGGRRFNPPHDYAHYLVERLYAPAYGFWGMIAAGAVMKNMQLIAGKRPPHSAERTRNILRMAEEAHTSCEGLVGGFQQIVDRNLDENWPAAKAVLDLRINYQTVSRPRTHEEVLHMCTEFREAAWQWSATPIGRSITVQWRTVLTGRERQFALAKRHSQRH
jgi:hypothetical protein